MNMQLKDLYLSRLILNKNVTIRTIYFGLFVFLTFSNCFGQERASFDFEKRETLKPIKMPDSSLSMTASPDNSAISTLFDNFSVNLQTANDALSGAILTGFRVPLKAVPGKKYIYYKQDLRGVINKDANARIVLFLALGNELVAIEFPYGKKYEENLLRSFQRRVRNASNLSYSATMAVIVERRSANSVAFIQIDSFDLAVETKPIRNN
jgi:hypothetical protein